MSLDRIVCGALVGLVAFAAASHVGLLFGGEAGPLWLPLWLAAGYWSAGGHARSPRPIDAPSCPRWLTAIAWVALGIVFLVLVHGATATPARHWDGTTSWWLRTQVLRDAPTLEQPFFTETAVYGHTREYPLLQPLLVASVDRLVPGCGGIVLPLMFALLLGCCVVAWRAAGVTPVNRKLLTLAIGLTPMWLAPTSGAVDSGFAEVSLAAAVTAIFAGIAGPHPGMILAGAMLATMLKPEGIAYPIVIGAALWLVGTRGQLREITYGWTLGALLWMPIYLRLAHSRVSVWLVAAAVVAVAVVAEATRAATDRLPRPRTARVIVLVAVFGLGLATLAMFRDELAAVDGVLGAYLQGGARAIDRLGRLPSILAGLAEQMFHVRKFGLTFAVVALLVILPPRWRGRCPSVPLALALALGLAFVSLPFLLSPEADLRHHLRSSADRLVLHWSGAAWLLIGVWWGRGFATAARTQATNDFARPQ